MCIRDRGITFLLVTHDQEEALSMSDRVCVMREGRIVQIGSPRDLYDRPVNRYVADFVGKANFFAQPGSTAVLSVRPERIEIAANPAGLPAGLATQVNARVLNRIFLGEHTEYRVHAPELGEIHVLAPRKAEGITGMFEPGDEIAVGWKADAALLLPET